MRNRVITGWTWLGRVSQILPARFAPRSPLAALSESPSTLGTGTSLRLARSNLDHESHRPRSGRHGLDIGIAALSLATGCSAAAPLPEPTTTGPGGDPAAGPGPIRLPVASTALVGTLRRTDGTVQITLGKPLVAK